MSEKDRLSHRTSPVASTECHRLQGFPETTQQGCLPQVGMHICSCDLATSDTGIPFLVHKRSYDLYVFSVTVKEESQSASSEGWVWAKDPSVVIRHQARLFRGSQDGLPVPPHMGLGPSGSSRQARARRGDSQAHCADGRSGP